MHGFNKAARLLVLVLGFLAVLSVLSLADDRRSAAISVSIKSLGRVLARAMTLLNEPPSR